MVLEGQIFRKGGNILKLYHTSKSCLALGAGVAALASTLLWTTPLIASDYSISGESNTIFRMRRTVDDKKLLPAYEYLRLDMSDERSEGTGVSFHLGAWGRADMGDKSTLNSADGDLQYAYLTYRAPKDNTALTIGRQFVSEGVAAERIDGVYLRNDFLYGFSASAFFGSSVVSEPSPLAQYQGGTFVYGARLSQSNKKYYTVGLSALKSDTEGGGKYREEGGIDLWLHPLKQIDLTGRSTYNSITKGWMENSYSLTYAPLSSLRFSAEYTNINFKDYLYNLTNPALSILNPVWNENNDMTAVGATAAYTGIENLMVAADYKQYSYDKSGEAKYFGGKASYSLSKSFVLGGSVHRMYGKVDKLSYYEYRAFASKKLGHTDLTLDATNVNYDKKINGISDSYAVTCAAGYELSRKLKVGADVEYSKNPEFNREVRALVKATYTFDTKSAGEGGTKSEK